MGKLRIKDDFMNFHNRTRLPQSVGLCRQFALMFFPTTTLRRLFSLILTALACVLPIMANPNSLMAELQLSPEAQIFLRGTQGYKVLTRRSQFWRAPDVAAVVQVASAEDVAATIRFANAHDIPFTAQSGGHGDTHALGNVKNGIQINLRKLNTVKLSDGGTYATVGGGTIAKELISTLWEHDKWTTTGACHCTGTVSVALGGGHGFLQGMYGLLADQLLRLEMVTADGSIMHVSETENADLFWAMRGAGHNFGIVTSADWKIHDVPETDIGGRTWSYEMFQWDATEENIRSVYGLAKDLVDSGKQSDQLMMFGIVSKTPSMSENAVITYYRKQAKGLGKGELIC